MIEFVIFATMVVYPLGRDTKLDGSKVTPLWTRFWQRFF